MKKQSSLIRYRHRQSGSTAYRLQATAALTGPGLQLTAMPCPGLQFDGRHLHDRCNYTDYYSFTDPRGMEGWLTHSGHFTHNVVTLKHDWYFMTIHYTNLLSLTKQHAIVNIQLNIVTCPTYPDTYRDYVVAPSVLLSIVVAFN